MSTEQKLDFLIAQIEELKAIIAGQKMPPKARKQPRQETKEEITNRLLAKIRIAADAEKAK